MKWNLPSNEVFSKVMHDLQLQQDRYFSEDEMRISAHRAVAKQDEQDLNEALTILDLIVNDPSLAVYDAVDSDFKGKRELGLSFLNKFKP